MVGKDGLDVKFFIQRVLVKIEWMGNIHESHDAMKSFQAIAHTDPVIHFVELVKVFVLYGKDHHVSFLSEFLVKIKVV